MSDIDLTTGHTQALIDQAKARNMIRNQLAYVLATARWETAHTMEPVKEAYWLSETWRKNNLRYYPWYGRGFVQLTWRENYEKAQTRLALGTLLTDDPDKALDADIAAQVIILGMIEGWFTGKKLDQYITLQKSDFVGARRIVNGTDRAAEIAKIAHTYDDLLTAAGYGIDIPIKPEVSTDTLVEYLRTLEDRIARMEKHHDSWSESS